MTRTGWLVRHAKTRHTYILILAAKNSTPKLTSNNRQVSLLLYHHYYYLLLSPPSLRASGPVKRLRLHKDGREPGRRTSSPGVLASWSDMYMAHTAYPLGRMSAMFFY